MPDGPWQTPGAVLGLRVRWHGLSVPPQPFDRPFYIVMTQTGGQDAPVGSKITMDVDWVRAWK